MLTELVTRGSGRPGACDTALSGLEGDDEGRCVACGADVGSRFIQRAPSMRVKKEVLTQRPVRRLAPSQITFTVPDVMP